jgi:transposase
MSVQMMLPFEEVPVTCPTQAKYHAIAPCLAGQVEPKQQAKLLNLSYSTVSKWLKQFREDGMKGLFPVASYNNREPYTPERIIVSLIYFKCCVPKVADRELSRVISSQTGLTLDHKTVKSLLERYFFWRYEEFQKLIVYPILPDVQSKRREIVKLDRQGWSEQSITVLVKCHRSTVRKWLRRNKEEERLKVPVHQQLLDYPSSPLKPYRKVYFGTMHTILKLQQKYPTAGWFRIRGYLLKDYDIELGQTTLKKVMKLNRKLHLIPRIERPIIKAEPKEPPPRSKEPFTYAFIDIRYLDAKPGGIQLYSCLLLEGFSRTILAGSLTSKQDVGIILRIYYLALLNWGLWKTIVSDNGSQFRSHAFGTANTKLGINQHFCEKGRPWQNLIESQFGIQARLGEYLWQQCRNVNEAIEVHRELIRDHNRLPHFAHRKRQDGKDSPLTVLGGSRGAEIDKTHLHHAFSRQVWQRRTNEKGFIRVGRWKIYVEEGLPKTPIELIYWDGKLRAEYRQEKLAEYDCRWNDQEQRPKIIEKPKHFETKYSSKQPELFEVGWLREPIEENRAERKSSKRVYSEQLKLPFSEAA